MKINGTLVVDAKSGIELEITKNDVRTGATKDPGQCAAARAIIRVLGAEAARVHIGRTYVKVKNKWVRYSTSPSLRREIVAFDRGGAFEPGIYRLLPCKASLALGSKRKPGTGNGKKNAKKRPYHVTTNIRAHGANK